MCIRDSENAEADGEGNDFGSKAKNAGRAVAGKLGPALAGAGAKAKGAAESVMALLKRRKAEKAEAEKAAQPRRTTAPAPGGGLKAEGKRLVRDDSGEDEDEAPPPPKTNRKAAAMGGALGLVAVLAIFGLTRFLGGRGGEKAQADRSTAALPAASVDASAGGPAGLAGVPTANVPLFGQTPLSTTEPAAAPPPSGSAVAAAPPAGGDDNGGSGEDSPPGDNGQILKEWGKGTVTKPKTLTFKMDGPIERITGAAGAAGFTITVPGHKSAVPSSDLTKKDNRLQSVDVVNGSRGAEISLKFKDGVPSGYLAKIKGDKLQIQLGTEPHSKVAKAKKGKKKPRD